jgi:hypothetical protein
MRALFIIVILSASGLLSAAYVWPVVAWALVAAAGLLVAYGVFAPKLPTWAMSGAGTLTCIVMVAVSVGVVLAR